MCKKTNFHSNIVATRLWQLTLTHDNSAVSIKLWSWSSYHNESKVNTGTLQRWRLTGSHRGVYNVRETFITVSVVVRPKRILGLHFAVFSLVIKIYSRLFCFSLVMYFPIRRFLFGIQVLRKHHNSVFPLRSIVSSNNELGKTQAGFFHAKSHVWKYYYRKI